jgi:hypothetical protein
LLWRLWSFAAGLPLGALGTLALRGQPGALELEVGAAISGLVFVIAVSLGARRFDDDPERGRHLAKAASAGLAALPALALARIGLPPDPWILATAVALLVVAAGVRAVRIRGPAGGPARQVEVALATPLVAGLVAIAASGAVAAFRTTLPPPGENFATFAWDVDADVALGPALACGKEPRTVGVVLERGAHPRIGADGRFVWFDAVAEDGRRQIHRLERGSGSVVCWTCAEAGNNRRPAPDPEGAGLAFDTDRYQSFWFPANTEVHVIGTAGDAPKAPSRRLTVAPGRDDHALLGPRGLIVWSRVERGSADVASASVRSGHGGVVLGSPVSLLRGGADWVAPVAWSRDARSFLAVRGNPFRPLGGESIDFAAGVRAPFAPGLPPAGAASFSGDGSLRVLAQTRRARGLGLLPGSLGFLLGSLPGAIGGDGADFQGSELRFGAGDGEPLDLGGHGEWGAPTGVTLAPDGTWLVLGQRRSGHHGVEERLLEVALDCS